MEDQYSDLLKTQKEQHEKLLGTRYDDIEKMQQMARPYAEILQVHNHYQELQNNLAKQHAKEREDYFKQKEIEREIREKELEQKAAERLAQLRKDKDERDRGAEGDRGRDR